MSRRQLDAERMHIRNFRWARRFWMRLLSSGSVTSVQLSDLDGRDLDDEDECFLLLEELWLLDDDGISTASSGSESTVAL